MPYIICIWMYFFDSLFTERQTQNYGHRIVSKFDKDSESVLGLVQFGHFPKFSSIQKFFVVKKFQPVTLLMPCPPC